MHAQAGSATTGTVYQRERAACLNPYGKAVNVPCRRKDCESAIRVAQLVVQVGSPDRVNCIVHNVRRTRSLTATRSRYTKVVQVQALLSINQQRQSSWCVVSNRTTVQGLQWTVVGGDAVIVLALDVTQHV
jgi:hypothetical protein